MRQASLLGMLLGWLVTSLACSPPPAPDAPLTPPPAGSAPPPAQPETAPGPESEPEPAPPSAMAPSPSGEQTPRAGICTDGPYANPPVQQQRATLIRDGFVFVEGPVWSDSLQSLLFSEMDFNADGSHGPPSKIHLLTNDQQLFTFLENSGTNGLAIDERGLWGATHDQQALSRFDLATKERTIIVSNIDGKKFNSPNDLTLSSGGHVYFTDPNWQLGTRPNETGVTGVYWVKPDNGVSLVDGTLKNPNGIALSPDEKTLYVGAQDGAVWSYPVKDGKPGPRRQFAKVDGPDGMAVDCAGNLYVASHGAGKVEVFDARGQAIASIQVAPKTTNCAFGGPERKTLYITAGSGVYAIETSVPGYPY